MIKYDRKYAVLKVWQESTPYRPCVSKAQIKKEVNKTGNSTAYHDKQKKNGNTFNALEKYQHVGSFWGDQLLSSVRYLMELVLELSVKLELFHFTLIF